MSHVFDYHGNPFAAGAYGQIFDVPITSAVLTELKRMQHVGVDVVFVGMPALGSRVAIKVQINKHEKYSTILEEWTHEATVHKRMHEKLADIVPKLYMAYAHPEYPMHITVMERVDGKPLKDVPMTNDLYDRVEKAVMRMWKAGIAHGDLHDGNMLVRANGSVIIIDFGMSENLPENIVRKVEQSSGSKEAWGHVRPHVDAIKTAKRYPWYNPNGKFLKVARLRAVHAEMSRRHADKMSWRSTTPPATPRRRGLVPPPRMRSLTRSRSPRSLTPMEID
jgi:tRNA A-37 threonylcarbamoyl transferase component Bud32